MKKVLLAFIFGLFMSVAAFAQTADDYYEDGKKQLLLGNEKKAFELFKKSANNGHAKAQGTIGMMYYKGHGVRQNYKKSRKWFLKSAENGDEEAQYMVGLMYYQGLG
jgi:FOG: TPR repeat, SEL1 subfamily